MSHSVSVRERRRGAVIALIGCDGSGKSTVSRWLVDELKGHGGNEDTQFVYFGTGDGPGSLFRRILNWLKKRSAYGKKPPVKADKDAASGRRPVSNSSVAPDYLRLIWAATVASERSSKMRHVKRAIRRGSLVVTDRYPQAEFWGIHDGPRLGYVLETKSGGWLYRIAQWEQSLYARFASCIPDLVLLLDVDPEVAYERRSEEPYEELKRRIHVARSLTFQGATRHVLDSTEPLHDVCSQALAAVLELESVRHCGFR